MIKKCFIDVETTGLDPAIHRMIQIGCIITDDTGQRIIDQFERSFAPDPDAQFSQGALDKVGFTSKELLSRELSSSKAQQEFVTFLSEHCNRWNPSDKMQFIAYNSAFDEGFVRAWFDSNYCADIVPFGCFFWNPTLCMQKVSAWYFQDDREKLPSFKLRPVCQACGIEFNEDDAHDALYDIQKMLELHRKLVQ